MNPLQQNIVAFGIVPHAKSLDKATMDSTFKIDVGTFDKKNSFPN